jgi:NAD(P)-dependent dehydrogenase (short-subunit alcohol dehydrogenase family)
VSETKSRTAIVMAAGQGIGEGIARHLGGIGYKLLLVSNGDGAAKLAKELGCLSFKGSIARKANIDATVALALASWDRIDLVVNNTGHPAR